MTSDCKLNIQAVFNFLVLAVVFIHEEYGEIINLRT